MRPERLLMTIALCGLVVLTGCDKAQLLAPTNSTINVSAPTRLLPSGGSTQITAYVIEEAGTPVQNGTTVRFSTSLGTVDPVEVQTTNGVAITTFFAGNTSGVAEIRALSGGAGSGDTGAGTGDLTATNVILITVGNAAINTVSIRATPGSVGPTGGSVTLVASVVTENGTPLEGISVLFNANQGTLSSPTAITNSSGEAQVTLTTAQQTVVSATAGSKTSNEVTISVRPAPAVAFTCTPAGSSANNCSAVQAGTSNTATVLFTVTPQGGSSTIRSATIDFGDGSTQALGNLIGGSATITHSYAGPSGSQSRSYTATLLITDVNGESTSVSVPVIVNSQQPLNVTLTATPGSSTPTVGNRVTFTATVTPTVGGADVVASYTWNFGDGSGTVTTSSNNASHVYTSNGAKTATVTITTTDGRTASGQAEFIITGI